MEEIRDKIGSFGPVITFFITNLNLVSQKKYLYSYLIFSCINHFLNPILKLIIREPRPKIKIESHEDLESRIKEWQDDKFGMPSYHAQSVFFSTTYLYLVQSNNYVLILNLFICALTVYQRWKFDRHDIRQLIAGSLIGITVGFIATYSTNHYLTSIF